MSWRTIQIEGVARIEREVARFTVETKRDDLPMAFRIKIIERADGDFIGYPEIAIKDAAGQPDWTSGRGASVEEALADTVRFLLETVQGKEPIAESAIWWDPRF